MSGPPSWDSNHNLPPNNVINLNPISWVVKEKKWCMKKSKVLLSTNLMLLSFAMTESKATN